MNTRRNLLRNGALHITSGAAQPSADPNTYRGVRFAFPPSERQTDLLDEAADGTGHVMINAVAGSGKSTSLEMLINFLKGTVLAIAFNKSIADALKIRFKAFANVTASTLHSHGFTQVRNAFPRVRFKPNGRKYTDIVKTYVSNVRFVEQWDDAQAKEAANSLEELASLARLTLTSFTDVPALEQLCFRYGIRGNGYLRHLPAVMKIGMQHAENGNVDFDDMVFLPVFWNLPIQQFDNVLVDECQDLNAAQRELAKRSVKGWTQEGGMSTCTGRSFWVGDPHQAIYGFAGADAESFRKIAEETQAKVMPLDVCYRCPVSHLELAQEIVPHIKPRPNAPKGEIATVKRADVARSVKPGVNAKGEAHDLIISRTNAPIIALCIELIGRGIAARVKGTDIGKKLIGILEQVEKRPGFRFAEIGRFIEEWAADRIAYLVSKDAGESAINGVRDMQAALDTCVESYRHTGSVKGIADAINALFSDKEAALWLSSVHRAKGLEAERVFILNPEIMPLRWPDQKPEEYAQELNVKYVAHTRAKQALFFIPSER